MPTPFSYSASAFGGADFTSGIETLPPQVNKTGTCMLSNLVNCRVTQDGGVGNRAGFTQLVDLATSAKVDSCVSLPVYSVSFWKSGTSIFQALKSGLDVGTAYTIGVTRTAGEIDFLFVNEKDVYATNFTDSFTRTAVSKVAAINSGANTFSVTAGDGTKFATGTVYIRGTAITDGTLSTDAYSGTSGLTGSMAIGDIVTQTTTPAAPKGTGMAAFQGSALVGRGDTLSVSLPSTDQEPQLFYDFSLTNGATAKRLSSGFSAVKTGLSVALVGMKDGIDVVTGFEPNSGGLLTMPVSRVHGVPNANCISEMDRQFVILTSTGRIIPAAQTLNGFELLENPMKPKTNFDYAVQGYIQKNIDTSDLTQNRVFYNPATRILKATILCTNGKKEFILQTDIGAWSIDDSKNINCRLVLDGAEYAGDDSTGLIHRDEFGTTDNGTPIISTITTGRFTPSVTGDYLSLNYRGVISGNGQFYQRIIHNDVIEEELILAEDMVADGQMSLSSGVSLGTGLLGAETMGGVGDKTEVFSFNYPYELLIEAESIQLEWQVQDEGSRLEIRSFSLQGETENTLLLNKA